MRSIVKESLLCSGMKQYVDGLLIKDNNGNHLGAVI